MEAPDTVEGGLEDSEAPQLQAAVADDEPSKETVETPAVDENAVFDDGIQAVAAVAAIHLASDSIKADHGDPEAVVSDEAPKKTLEMTPVAATALVDDNFQRAEAEASDSHSSP
eukprot:Platyproteum_vivax@DN15046_c0_g1_i1.p1